MSDIDNKNKEINEFLNKSYEYGFTTEIESETIPSQDQSELVGLFQLLKGLLSILESMKMESQQLILLHRLQNL